MRCPRIFCAYTHRLFRRHTTWTSMAVFFFVLILILQYYKTHRRQSYKEHLVGDFDYVPGGFLSETYPNENISYCKFNYGLPESLNWSTIQVYPSPELGTASPYRVIYNALEASAFQNATKYKAVTYATQATPEYLYNIVEIARYWDGPISVSVYVPDYDLDIVIQILEQLCHCYYGMSKVTLHLFYPKTHPPRIKRDVITTTTEQPTSANISMEEILRKKKDNYKNLTGKARAEYVQRSIQKKIKNMMTRQPTKRSSAPILTFNDCSGLDYFDIPTFRREFNMLYPINVGRNVARNGTKTTYFLVSDIELVPNNNLASKFTRFLQRLIKSKRKNREGAFIMKTVFVVPIFELVPGVSMPRQKSTLVELVANNQAMYFHQKTCSHCQRFPGMQTWLKRPEHYEVEPMLITKREYPYHRWEPVYFGTNREPWYSEYFSWEGLQDKMTQMLELCLQNYRTVILDGAFLCHAATHPSKQKSPHNRAVIKMNNQHYVKVLKKFMMRYPERDKCVMFYGLPNLIKAGLFTNRTSTTVFL